MNFYFPDGSGIFKDDNARSSDRFMDHEGSFSHIEWPLQTLDLNPIEKFGDQLERDLRGLPPLPSSLKDLSQRLLGLW